MLYEAFDSFLNTDTWYTREAPDLARFYVALNKVIGNPKFNADELGNYMRERKKVSHDDGETSFNVAIRQYADAAWAVKEYLKANRMLGE